MCPSMDPPCAWHVVYMLYVSWVAWLTWLFSILSAVSGLPELQERLLVQPQVSPRHMTLKQTLYSRMCVGVTASAQSPTRLLLHSHAVRQRYHAGPIDVCVFSLLSHRSNFTDVDHHCPHCKEAIVLPAVTPETRMMDELIAHCKHVRP